MIRHKFNQLSERTRNDILNEQMPAGLNSMLGGMGGQAPQEEISDDQKLFDRFKQYGQIDEFIQLMRMEGWNDEHILGKIKKKFYPEFVYWARQHIFKDAEQSKKMGMQRQASDADFDGIPDEIDI
jgi:hypothetical protein